MPRHTIFKSAAIGRQVHIDVRIHRNLFTQCVSE
jgi:hypothetical protein